VEPFAQAVESWHDFLSDDWHGNSNLDRFFVDINDHCSFGVARLYPQSVMARISDDPIDFGCQYRCLGYVAASARAAKRILLNFACSLACESLRVNRYQSFRHELR
jgi:hypothetical protein